MGRRIRPRAMEDRLLSAQGRWLENEVPGISGFDPAFVAFIAHAARAHAHPAFAAHDQFQAVGVIALHSIGIRDVFDWGGIVAARGPLTEVDRV